jgi:hypothetical protein
VILRIRENIQKDTEKQLKNGKQMVDVYGFSMLMYTFLGASQ